MKIFIIKLSIFTLMLASINTLLFWKAYSIYYSPYSSVSMNFKCVLLADSHGLPLGDSTEKFGVYNFSAGSDSYPDMYRKLAFLIKHTRIDTVFIGVDDHMLSPYREILNNLDRSVVFSLPNEFSNTFHYAIEKYLRRFLVFFQPKALDVINLYIRNMVKGIISDSENKKQKEINSPWRFKSWEERIHLSKKRAADQFAYSKSSSIMKSSLLALIDICEVNNIQLIGIKFPLSFAYIETIKDRTYNAEIVLSSREITVRDFKNIYIQNSGYFKDQDHLTDFGGHKFAELLFYRE
jgi:hypothetical protein